MIVEFTFGNFRSFKNVETFSMVAAPLKSKNKEIDILNTFKAGTIKLLRSKAIFGSNASGKSNIIKAITLVITLLRNSVKDDQLVEKFAAEYFALDEEGKAKPLFFQIVFLHDGTQYRYGFSLQGKDIIAEWLFSFTGKTDVYLFKREGMDVKVNDKRFFEAKKFQGLTGKGDNEIFRSNSLFLSSVAAMGVLKAQDIMNALSVRTTVLQGIDENYMSDATLKQVTSEEGNKEILELLQSADFNISSLEVLQDEVDASVIPKEVLQRFPGKEVKKFKTVEFKSRRAAYNTQLEKIGEVEKNFEYFESEGTKKFFLLGAILLRTLRSGNTLVIDELDARLHPLLTKKIVSLFHSETTNPHEAQLIFVTHDTNLLKPSFLRRDQICFVDKDRFGSSIIRTLIEYKGIRNDASYDKDYLQGKYKAVPFLNQVKKVVESKVLNNESKN